MVEKAETLHQPVISIRISEELRSRLETLKEVIAHKTGQTRLHIRGRKATAGVGKRRPS